MVELLTSAISSSWTPLEDVPGREVEIINNTNALMEVRYASAASGKLVEIAPTASVILPLGTKTSDLQVKGTGAGNFSLIVK